MIKSMTGFGRSTYENEGRNVVIYDSYSGKDKKDPKSIVVTFERYDGWNDNLATNIESFYGMKNNIYYYYKMGSIYYKEYSNGIVSSFKFK